MMKRLVDRIIRHTLRPVLSPKAPLWLQRAGSDAASLALLAPPRASWRKHIRHLAGVATTVITPQASVARFNSGISVLYLHGGGYVVGGPGSHSKLAAWVARAANATVWLPDYRRAPEAAYPAARDDALAVYRALLAEGQDPQRLVLAGDSAGGGLALATAVAIRDAGLPLPAGLVLLSPWVDLSLSGDTLRTHASRDAMLQPDWIRWCAEAYRSNAPATEPGCSPLFADLRGLPPLLIQVGSEEILLDDARRLAAQAHAAGVPTELDCYDGVGHVFQFHARLLREADQSLERIGAFVARVTGDHPPV